MDLPSNPERERSRGKLDGVHRDEPLVHLLRVTCPIHVISLEGRRAFSISLTPVSVVPQDRDLNRSVSSWLSRVQA